jgi:precorrin-2 dehydrogenase/sirohydrochlorin ferrochelatase
MLDGESLWALVVGGGAVATRKVRALVEAGATVHVVALDVTAELSELASRSPHLEITRCPYDASLLGDATLVIAATNDAAVNARIAADARGRLVNVVTAPELGNVATPAVHRAGDLVIAVSAGRLPSAAARIRDAVAERFDSRYAAAVDALASMRRALLDAGRRERWGQLTDDVIGHDFCDLVESGELEGRMAAWR